MASVCCIFSTHNLQKFWAASEGLQKVNGKKEAYVQTCTKYMRFLKKAVLEVQFGTELGEIKTSTNKMLETLKVLLLTSFVIKKKYKPLQIMFGLDLTLVILRCRIV